MKVSQEEKRKFIHANLCVDDVFITANFRWRVVRVGECLTDMVRHGSPQNAPLITFDNAELYDELEAGELTPAYASEAIQQLGGISNGNA